MQIKSKSVFLFLRKLTIKKVLVILEFSVIL